MLQYLIFIISVVYFFQFSLAKKIWIEFFHFFLYYSYSFVLNSYQLLVLFYSSIPYIDWSKFLTFIPFLLKFQKYIKLVCAISFINRLTRGKKKVYNIIEKRSNIATFDMPCKTLWHTVCILDSSFGTKDDENGLLGSSSQSSGLSSDEEESSSSGGDC